jgi:hypothetical protein
VGKRLELEFFLVGYLNALGRAWGIAERRSDVESARTSKATPELDVYMALFEALNWAVSLDDRLRREWPVNVSAGRDWWRHVDGGEVARAVRFARNAVHHDWSDAITLPGDPELAYEDIGPWLWRWKPSLRTARPDPDGDEAYRRWLAGRSALETLAQLSMGFMNAVSFVHTGEPLPTPDLIADGTFAWRYPADDQGNDASTDEG